MKGGKRFGLILLLSVFLLTGCWDFREVEHVVYLNALGVDYVKGKYVLYAQVIDFTNLSKQEIGGGRHPEKSAVGKGIGDSFDQAAFDLYHTVQGRVSWAHVSTLVFTERAVEANILMQAIDLMRRYHEMRHTIWTFGTKDSLDDIFAATPIMNISILYSRLTSPEDPYRQNSDITPMFLNQVISSIKEPAETTLLPFLSISKTRWKMGEEPHPILQVNGVGAIFNAEYHGFVAEPQVKGLRWTQPHHPRNPLFMFEKGRPLAAAIFLRPTCKFVPVESGGKLYFDLRVKVQGGLLEVTQKMSTDEVRQAAAKQIESEIRTTFEEGIARKSDLLNLGLYLYRQEPETWHRLSRNAALPLTKNSLRNIEVDVQLLSSGKLKQ